MPVHPAHVKVVLAYTRTGGASVAYESPGTGAANPTSGGASRAEVEQAIGARRACAEYWPIVAGTGAALGLAYVAALPSPAALVLAALFWGATAYGGWLTRSADDERRGYTVWHEMHPRIDGAWREVRHAVARLAHDAVLYEGGTPGSGGRRVHVRAEAPRLIRSSACAGHVEGLAGRVSFLPDGAYLERGADCTIVPYADLAIQYARFNVPHIGTPDPRAQIVGRMYAHSNADGAPDRRYSSNPSLPVVEYGAMFLTVGSGSPPHGTVLQLVVSPPEALERLRDALEGYRHAWMPQEAPPRAPGGASNRTGRRAGRPWYEVLGTRPDCTENEAWQRYQELLSVYGPDGAAQEFHDEARERVAEFRHAYDEFLGQRAEGRERAPGGAEDAAEEEPAAGGSQARASQGSTVAHDWRSVLGLQDSCTRAEARQRYHDLVQLNHPDKVAHMGAEFRELAERRMREINSAYEQLRSERGWS